MTIKHSDLIDYFKQRLLELYHTDTIDSYRVRHHNIVSILNELSMIIEGWLEKSVKNFTTVASCIEETVDLINSDSQFSYNCIEKENFVKMLLDFSKNLNTNSNNFDSYTGKYLVFIINKLLEHNSTIYFSNLWDAVEKVIFEDDTEINDQNFIPSINVLDKLTTDLAREILNKGFSKRSAFYHVKRFLVQDNGIESFKDLRRYLSNDNEGNFIVIISTRLNDIKSKTVLNDFVSNLDLERLGINENLLDQTKKNFIRNSERRRFFIHKTKAIEAQTAVKKAKRVCQSRMDAFHLGASDILIEIDDYAMVVQYDNNDKLIKIYLQPTNFPLDGKYANNTALSNLYSSHIKKINKNNSIDPNTKIRIDGALRHLRMGNVEYEVEQKFINYWIALEFIFSSPSIDQNTFNRLRENLTNILAVSYVKRNFIHFEKVLRKKKLLNDNESLSKQNIDDIFNRTDDLLIKYRLKKFKSRLFIHKDKRKDYIIAHRKNLERHLIRIYHHRNLLIHEAAINQEIDDLTSNLRYYLVFLLEQMVRYFLSTKQQNNSKQKGIEDFFYEYKMMYDYISTDWSLEKILSVPVFLNHS